MTRIEELQKIIDESQNIVFFGGAGVSTESGIPDFRSQDGLYNQKYKYPPERIVSHSFFRAKTEEFYEFYKDKMIFPEAKPNAAHLKLAELEKAGKLSAVITQNIDGLHQMAGSKNVLELHGSIHRNYCQRCGKFYAVDYIMNSEGVPKCEECGGLIKPDVVLYEEGLDARVTDAAVRAIASADTLIIGGTSLIVYPAASYINYFRGRNLVVINKSDTARSVNATLTVLGELLFVVATVIVVLIARAALPSVFRFKRVRFLSLVGVYMMWRALITVGVFLTETAIYFFPKLGESSDGVTDLITHLSFPMAILVIAILPAVCEEMLFRGPILRSLEFIKIPALIIVVDGLIFAAAHLSFIKMIPITILGIYLAYGLFQRQYVLFDVRAFYQ